jgi:hydrogenase expression/formation protein HypE
MEREMTSRSDKPIDRMLEPGKLPGPLLARLVEQYRTLPDPSVTITAGYGRDAAAIEIGGETLIVKSDPITFATEGAARYLIAVNANDISCLGGIPRWMTVVALLPEDATTEASVEQLFSDLKIACDAHRISILGGHTEITLGIDRPLLIGTMLGVVGPHGVLEPGNAKEGNDLFLTRWAGIEGTALLARELSEPLTAAIGAHAVRAAAKLLRTPGISVVSDAMALRPVPGLTAMHDPTEGGVATAIHELAEASGLGAEVFTESIPLLPETRAIADHFDLDPFGMLSSGALLIAVDRRHHQDVLAIARQSSIPIAHIGRLAAPSNGVIELNDAVRCPLPRYDRDEVTRVL